MDADTIDYRTEVTWTGGESGSNRDYERYSRDHRAVVEGKPAIELSVAPQFHGNHSKLETEELLLMAVSGCHMMTYLAVTARRGVEVLAYIDRPSATLRLEDNGGRIESLTLRPEVQISSGSDPKLAEALHSTASDECFVGNSVNFPIAIDCKISVRA